MKIILIKFSLIAILLLQSFPVNAQELDAIKDDVFKDCPSALQSSLSLTPELKRDLIGHLIRVLEIQKDTPRPKTYEPAASTTQPGYLTNNPANTLRRLELLKAYEPERDEDAKECAIEILKLLVPYSLEATPRLIEICSTDAHDQPHKDKIRKLIWQLTLATKSATGYQIPVSTINELTETALLNEGYLAENILYELSPETLRIIVAELKKPSRTKRRNNIKLLFRLDPSGTIIGQFLLPYLNSSDDNLRLEVALFLGQLASIHESALQPIIDATNDPSMEVANAAYHTLTTILLDKNLVTNYQNKETLFASLITNLNSAFPDRRDLIEKTLIELVNQTPNPSPHILTLLQSKDEDLKIRGLEIAKKYNNKDTIILNAAQDLLYHSSLTIRLEAISALSTFKEPYAKDSIKALSRLLKTLNKETASSAKEELVLKVIEAAASLPNTYNEGLQSYFIEALAYRPISSTEFGGTNSEQENRHPAVLALIHLGGKGVPLLLKVLKTKNNSARIRALYALRKISPATPEMIKQISALLKDPNAQIRSETQATLVTIGDVAIKDLQKALSLNPFEARYGAAKALLELGDASPMVTLVLMEGIKQEGCRDKSFIATLLKSSNPTIKAEIEDQLYTCLGTPAQDNDYILEALSELAPLEQPTLAKIVNAMVEKKFSDDLILSIGENGEKLGLSRISLISALKLYLPNPNNKSKARAINALGHYGEDAKAVLPDLIAIFHDQNQEDLIRHKAIVAITKIEPANTLYKKFLSEELLTEKSPFAINALLDMAPILSLPLIAEIFERLPEDTKANVLKLFEHYPNEAKSFDNFIIKQLYSPNPSVRTHSLSILLKSNIACPELIYVLRNEILGKHSSNLVEDMPPEPLTSLLNEIIRAPLSKTEQRNAEVLLKKISGTRPPFKEQS